MQIDDEPLSQSGALLCVFYVMFRVKFYLYFSALYFCLCLIMWYYNVLLSIIFFTCYMHFLLL